MWEKVVKSGKFCFNFELSKIIRFKKMASYIGEFECKLDNKGRLSLPSKLRAQITETDAAAMVINRGFEKCLVLYTKADWEKELEKLSVLNEFNREARQFIRIFNNGANIIQIDNAGRALIPKKLMEYASLKDDAIINAYGKKIEIWDKAIYETALATDADDFADMAQKLLGGSPQNTPNNE